MGEALELTEEELLELAAKLEPTKKASSKSSKKKKGREPKDPGSLSQDGPNPEIWRTTHYYMRPGESEQKVDFAAREERKDTGPATIIFAHYHMFGEPCVDKCKERVI